MIKVKRFGMKLLMITCALYALAGILIGQLLSLVVAPIVSFEIGAFISIVILLLFWYSQRLIKKGK